MGEGLRSSPRISSGSGHNSPIMFRDSNSPHLSIMMAGTPPVFDTGTPSFSPRRLREGPLSISTSSLDPSAGVVSPDSPNGQSTYRTRRPFSDNSVPVPRLSPSALGHAQSRQLRTSASSPASLDCECRDDGNDDDVMPSDEMMLQQVEHKPEARTVAQGERGGDERGEDMGITKRRRNPNQMLSQSSSRDVYQRPSMRESRENKLRAAKSEEMKEDKKLKRSFKDLISGIFSKKGSR